MLRPSGSAGSAWPTPPRRSGATAGSTSSISIASGRRARRRRASPGRAGAGRRPGAAEAVARRRTGRGAQRRASCTTSSTTTSSPRASRLRPRHVRGGHGGGAGPCSQACRPTRSPTSTTRSSPEVRSSRSRPVSSSSKPIIVLHWSEGDGLATFPHTLVVAEESSEVTVVDRFGSPEVGAAGHLVDAVVELVVGDDARLRYLSVQEHGPHTWQVALQRAHVGRRRLAALVGGGARRRLRRDYAASRCSRATTPRATSWPSTSATTPRCSTSAPSRTTTPPARVATCCSRARSRIRRTRCTRGSSGSVRTRAKAVANQTNRNLVLTEGAGADSIPNLEIEANDVRCSHATRGRAHRRGPALLPREPRCAAGGGGATDRARVLRRCSRPPAHPDPGPGTPAQPWSTRSSTAVGDLRGCARSRTSRRDPPGASTSTVSGCASCASATTSTSSTTPARTPTTRWRRATCGKTSARSSARSTASTFSLETGEPATLPATQPVPVYDVKIDGDDVVVTNA